MTSAADTASMSTVPTGVNSPYLDLSGYNSYVRLVFPDGDVDDFNYVVYESYGRTISPDTYWDVVSACYIDSSGDVDYSQYYVTYSYGQSYIIKVRFTTRIISVLYMKGAIKYEIY